MTRLIGPPPTVTRMMSAADADPDAVCVEDPQGPVSRWEFRAELTSIGAALSEMIGPGALVAVLLDRDRHLPAALLGVHAAESAYLTVDPAMPDVRLHTLLGAVPVTAVLTSRALAARVPPSLPALLVDDLTWVGPRPSRPSPPQFVGVAYLLYTSGSTGAPKCVQVGHESLDVHISGLEATVGSLDGQVWQAVSPIGFDSHITEILVALTGGAVLCLGPRDPLSVMSGHLVTGTSRNGPVTHMQCTPSLLRLLVTDPEALAALRGMTALLVGGEPFPAELIPRFTGSPVRLFNVYGPTEATVWVAVAEVTAATTAPVPIGRAVERTHLKVLDDAGQETATGAKGRLFIGGDCLAHGYFGDPELTARRFVPDPWSTTGGKLYDTGDVAFRDAAGDILVTGRADNQIKVRGNRVELDEIELVLRSHPDIGDAVVVPDRKPDARTLSATIVAPADLDMTELGRWLAERLAEYQVPTTFAIQASLPRNDSAKVDRGRAVDALSFPST